MESFTCLIKKEADQYASLCIELDIASCGNTKEEATQELKNAIEAYLTFMIEEGRGDEIYRPVEMRELKSFIFPEDTRCEESISAISLDFEYA